MKISCNKLKSHIKNADAIDWIKIWDKFSIRTAEVEGVEIKGSDIDSVVVGKIVECESHPTKEKYHVLKVDNGDAIVDILCGAPNVRKNLKVPIVKVGGKVSGFTIEPKKIAGVLSQGMLCSQRELGIGDAHEGILELPDNWIVGVDIKEYIPIDDIVVEIDNKSLTNRPDLWGHYGIAREIAAITNNSILPLDVAEIPTNLKDLKISIKDPTTCFRYMALKMDNITNNITPIDMQVFLYYAGMRSISLLVDLTNYVMLELGQPMHAFDSKIVNKIEVGKAKNNDIFKTLDGNERKLSNDMLMIKNDNEYFAIAGVMGGLDSEILEDTTSVFLESATFDSTSVRKTSTALGLRTEASARYEKSLDPNLASVAVKRFTKLLQDENPDLTFISNLTDCYPTKTKEKVIVLTKEKLHIYMGKVLKDKIVEQILKSLEFKVKVLKDSYEIIVPTFRATKDVSMAEDIIEEIARMYGYENFELKPLKLALTFTEHENVHNSEYSIKKHLATKYDLNEVHTYLWNKTSNLNKFGIQKQGITLLGKSEDNILRDDLGLSLLEIAKENLKFTNKIGIFEIGTVIKNGENKRELSILLADNVDNTEKLYYEAKKIVVDIFKVFKKIDIKFKKTTTFDYYDDTYSYAIMNDNSELGIITLCRSKLSRNIAKKTVFVVVNIDYLKYLELEKNTNLYEDISKYPTIELDYTIIASKDTKYESIETILNQFKSNIINNYELIDIYEDGNDKKITIRFVVGSYEKTLSQDDIAEIQKSFIKHIKDKNLSIVE